MKFFYYTVHLILPDQATDLVASEVCSEEEKEQLIASYSSQYQLSFKELVFPEHDRASDEDAVWEAIYEAPWEEDLMEDVAWSHDEAPFCFMPGHDWDDTPF